MKINYTFNKKKGEEIIETDEKFDDIIKGLLKIIKECKKIQNKGILWKRQQYK